MEIKDSQAKFLRVLYYFWGFSLGKHVHENWNTRRVPEEIDSIIGALGKRHSTEVGLRTYHFGAGDQFFSSRESVDQLRARIPDVLCVEMEGAAVAQICHEHQIPFSIIRTISDSGDEGAASDFPEFLRNIAGPYALGVVSGFLSRLALL